MVHVVQVADSQMLLIELVQVLMHFVQVLLLVLRVLDWHVRDRSLRPVAILQIINQDLLTEFDLSLVLALPILQLMMSVIMWLPYTAVTVFEVGLLSCSVRGATASVWIVVECGVVAKLVLSITTLEVFHVLVDVHAMRPLDVHEELLSVASDLRTWPSFDVLFDFLPIFSVNVKSWKRIIISKLVLK